MFIKKYTYRLSEHTLFLFIKEYEANYKFLSTENRRAKNNILGPTSRRQYDTQRCIKNLRESDSSHDASSLHAHAEDRTDSRPEPGAKAEGSHRNCEPTRKGH